MYSLSCLLIITAPASTSSSNTPFSFADCDDIPAAFSLLTAEISKLLKSADFFTLRRAVLQHRIMPNGVRFPDNLYNRIEKAQDLDTLLDLLTDSNCWSWVDLRLLETLIMSSGIGEAKILLNMYKKVIFSKKLIKVLDKVFTPEQKREKDAYILTVGSKLQKHPHEITVADLSQNRNALEEVIRDINSGYCVLEHFTSDAFKVNCLNMENESYVCYESYIYKLGLCNNRYSITIILFIIMIAPCIYRRVHTMCKNNAYRK